jgi:predicted hotdog family 3-hydroxylacyl-ACP dehydratase
MRDEASGDLLDLIPHRPPARMVDAVLEIGDRSIVCSGSVPTASPFAASGEAVLLGALEMAAQAAAIHGGFLADPAPGPPAAGYIVRLRDVRFGGRAPRPGEQLSVTATLTHSIPPLAIYSVSASTRAGDLVATATIGVLEERC